MKIVITGGTGFIGNRFTELMTDAGHQIVNLDRWDSSHNVLWFADWLTETNPDAVVHLATHYARNHTIHEIEAMINSNVLFGSKLLEGVVVAGVPVFINIGTSFQHYLDDDYNPVNLYAATKQAFQDICRYYEEVQAKTKIIHLKLSDTYGQDDTRGKLLNIWHHGTGPFKMSPGDQKADILHVDDVVNGIFEAIRSAKSYSQGSIFSLYATTRPTLKELAELFSEVTGKKLEIEWGARPYASREVMKPQKFIPSLPNWNPMISLKDGLRSVFSQSR
jgi:CDP-3, 6-dideoxy-D-glycero-L-glycero-4-hexulose-4-reductase